MTLPEKEALFIQYISTHKPFFLSFLTKKLPYTSFEDKEDIIQEGLSRAAANLESYNPNIAEMSTWIMRIIQNYAIEWHRFNHREKRRKSRTVSLNAELNADGESLENLIPIWDSPDDERLEIIRAQLETLPDVQRRLVELSYFQHLSISEIAPLLNLTISSASTMLNLGLVKLRRNTLNRLGELERGVHPQLTWTGKNGDYRSVNIPGYRVHRLATAKWHTSYQGKRFGKRFLKAKDGKAACQLHFDDPKSMERQ